MKGPLDNPVIKYDIKGAKEKVKEDVRSEKQTLKSILYNEFGWFKKDSTLNKNQIDKKNGEKFIIKWDEEEKQDKKEDEDF